MRALHVPDADEGTRLDQWLGQALGCSRREAQRLIADGAVRIDGARASKGARLRAGATVRVEHGAPGADDKRPTPEPELPLAIVHVDDAIVAMVKPPGIPTHPLRPGERGTLANALVARYPECAQVSDDPREGGVAHRLDRDTSGVVLAARTRVAWSRLRHAFADGIVAKEYLALVAGLPPPHGRVDAPLVHVGKRARVARSRDLDAQPASTAFEVLAHGHELALVRATTSSGRMHQVRVHLMHLGHPIVGDALYGGPPPAPGTHGHFLHASAIAFPHPMTGSRLALEAALPPDRAIALLHLVNWPQPGS